MAMPAKFDVEEVAGIFINSGRTAEQIDLVKEFREAVVHAGPRMKMLLAAVTEEAYRNKLQPVNAMGLAMMYGMVVGVLCERERVQRNRRIT